MTSKYKPGDKVWVKARVVSNRGVGDGEAAVRIDTSFGESTIAVVSDEDVIREARWQPIEGAPKDGTWILVACAGRRPDEDSFPASVAKWGKGYLLGGGWGERWCVDGNVDLDWYPDPTHYMLIPKLEVE